MKHLVADISRKLFVRLLNNPLPRYVYAKMFRGSKDMFYGWLTVFALLIVLLFLWAAKIFPSGIVFNDIAQVFGSVYFISPVFAIPTIGILVVVINLVLSSVIYEKNSTASLLLTLFAGLVVVSMVVVTIWNIVMFSL